MKRILLAALTSVILVTSKTASAQEVITRELAKNVYAVSILHYTSLVVLGDDEVLITDTTNPFRAAILRRELERLTEKPVGKIVLTHEHFDHNGGTELFPEAEVVAHRNFAEYEGLDPLGMLPPKIHVTYTHQMAIDMGTTAVELTHYGASDGIAVSVIHLPKEKIVVTADMYTDGGLNRAFTLTDTNLLGNRRLLNMLAGWDLEHAINVHSVSTDLAPLWRKAEFLNDLYDAMLPTLQEVAEHDGSQLVPTIIEMSETLKLPEYADFENYEASLPTYIRKMGFAMIHGG
ncbi:MBL fold metallo-hydrolase [Ruegeria arenilitoris]|uniref:MBL fold metallo-hydrolase n=1 Tax=Ruegeria arenilitoris TaxID=1173585 RepID=UPI001481BEE8|nr:MBL fold metallo-hydrolase [Ruegeria arenilitoris]